MLVLWRSIKVRPYFVWDMALRISVLSYRRFGTNCWSHLQPTGCPETPVITNTRCVTCQKSEHLIYTAVGASNPAVIQTSLHVPTVQINLATFKQWRPNELRASRSWQYSFTLLKCQDRFSAPKRAVLVLKKCSLFSSGTLCMRHVSNLQ